MARRPDGWAERSGNEAGGQRLDKWLWYARVAKTRTLAAGLVSDGKVRVNRQKVTKPAHVVRVGDVVTVTVARGVRVLRIEAPGARRGPASEAAELYHEIVPLPSGRRSLAGAAGAAGDEAAQQDGLDHDGAGAIAVAAGKGRPTKRERCALERIKPRFDEG
jgi:ribosome-associated heat shock protein Hsp15